ncbi:MAG: GNAT family N-acetyltransferase [Anaerolineae bacterium]
MSSNFSVRRVNPTPLDVQALSTVERGSLADSPYTPEEMAAILRRPEHHAYLAMADEQAAGFCSCFETPSNGGARLEIDMLGVIPAHRGRGLAKALIRHAMEDALMRGVRRFRAVVALDNLPSQHAFRDAGLEPADPPVKLEVYDILGNSPMSFLLDGWSWGVETGGEVVVPYSHLPPMQAHQGGGEVLWVRDNAHRLRAMAECLRVQTLAYSGLWIERTWSVDHAFVPFMAPQWLYRAIIERAKALDLDEVGGLVPAGAAHAMDGGSPLQHEGFVVVGPYLVFTAEERSCLGGH